MAMDFYSIKTLMEDNPALKVLRASSAALILGFLHAAFKERHCITVSNAELVPALAAYLVDTGYDEAREGDALERAGRLIETWCGDENRYLRKYLDDRGAAIHELTSPMERVLRWIEDLEPREFVGTESRFQDILRRLRELVEESTEDPEQRVAELRRKKKEIEAEIARIVKTGTAETLSTVQIRERFEELGRSSRDLLSDFKEVEQVFRGIVLALYREQSESDADRGTLLAYALDTVDALHSSPQGQSFDSFWRFLVADSGRDEIDGLVNRLFDLMDARGLSTRDTLLKYLKRYLHQAGKKVLDTNHLLAERLNRILSQQIMRERRKTRELIHEIKRLVLCRLESPPASERFLTIETNPSVSMVMERPLSLFQIETDFSIPERADPSIDQADASVLFNQFSLDVELIERRIRASLEGRDRISLHELVERYPPEKGLAEILAYFAIASKWDTARIDGERVDRFSFLTSGGEEVSVRLPTVLFAGPPR